MSRLNGDLTHGAVIGMGNSKLDTGHSHQRNETPNETSQTKRSCAPRALPAIKKWSGLHNDYVLKVYPAFFYTGPPPGDNQHRFQILKRRA